MASPVGMLGLQSGQRFLPLDQKELVFPERAFSAPVPLLCPIHKVNFIVSLCVYINIVNVELVLSVVSGVPWAHGLDSLPTRRI